MKFVSHILFLLSSSSTSTSAFFLPASSHRRENSRLYYDIQRDDRPNDNVWSVLATTERWISDTLANAKSPDGTNPLSRKEVSYVCETSADAAMVLASIFRKLKEARQLGEAHGEEQEEFLTQMEDETATPATMRQTQVLVIPSSPDMNNWHAFDALVTAINQARRNARDYVTDVSFEKLDERVYGEGDTDWVVSINCAHLHPEFGVKTPEQELKELQEEEEEVDVNLQQYKERRLQARRSPFPSVVVEVRAMPPPEFTPPPPVGKTAPEPSKEEDNDGEVESQQPNSEIVQQLEMLFSKSSIEEKKGGDFYDSIGSHIKEVSSVTPMAMAQNWVQANDELFDAQACAFTTNDTPHVDEAYEFVFTNLAMQSTEYLDGDNDDSSSKKSTTGAQKRQYLVMPHFLSSSATSMEKFTKEAKTIIDTLPILQGKVNLECFHPEHIMIEKRCPVPVLALQWKD